MTNNCTYLTGTVLDEDMSCSFTEICRICDVSAELVTEMIDEGLLCPKGKTTEAWFFSAIEIKRIQTTIRLQRDLRINLPGCALALQLMEELEALRQLHRKR